MYGGNEMMVSQEILEFLKKEFRLVSEDGIKLKQIGEGLSGAEVYFLLINNAARSRDDGNYILKIIDTTSPWFSKNDNECNKASNIYSTSPYYQRHLVKIRAKQYIGNRLIIVYFYALKSRLNSISLDKAQIDVKCKILKRISYELLDEFNGKNINTVNVKAYQLLKKWLKYRLDEDGNFKRRIEALLYSPEKPAFNYKGFVLPNPLFYISKFDEYLDCSEFQFFVGKIHGDLHQKNILIHKIEKADDYSYVLIDYDNFEEENFLFFDHAYLELNILFEELQYLDLYSWTSAIKGLMEKELSDKNRQMEMTYICSERVRDCICDGIIKWYKKNYPELIDSIKIQYILSRIAAGINFLCKNGISDKICQTKFLVYAAVNIGILFEQLGIDWNKENTGRIREREKDSNYTEFIWHSCDRFKRGYTKILFTDDIYQKDEYKKILDICRIEWSLIVDIGNKPIAHDLYSNLASQIKQNRNFTYIDNYEEKINFSDNTCFWLDAKDNQEELKLQYWIRNKKNVYNSIVNIIGNAPLRPILFIFDCHKDAYFMNKILEYLLETNILKKGTVVVSLGDEPEDDIQSLLSIHEISYYHNQDANLIDLSNTVVEYGINRELKKKNISIPSLSNLSGEITATELKFYESSIELVYDGIETLEKNYDYGKSFYKGNEIKWLDLEQNHDIRFYKYDEKLEIILEKLEKCKTSVCRLIHAAGAGGSTLAKRLMWDVKSVYPVVRIKRYTSDTINILSELYRKSGKCIFAVIEAGSTVISEEEFSKLIGGVDAQSCRALFLRIERLGNTTPDKIKSNKKKDIILEKELPPAVANKFFNEYSKMTNDINRIKNLECITYERNSEEWGEQCCPFFYGFYTFQDEYEGLDNFLNNTLRDCSDEMENILSDLSLITIYSQNICMSYEEMAKKLNVEVLDYYEIFKKLDEGIKKILIQREQGFRICHPLIAEKILDCLYREARENKIYLATIAYIDRMYELYEKKENEYVNKIFRELFIDRSYIDGEKQSFSEIITAVSRQTLKKKIFDHLISLYPDNPYYYNHLGRLEAYEAFENSGSFEFAIAHLNKAIKVAEKHDLDPTSHYTTLGCIYSRKVINYIISLKKNKKQITITRILEEIRCDFGNGTNYFLMARERNHHNTYGYFPNILMICNVVNYIVQYTKKDVNRLLENSDFKEWYDLNVGKAVQLYAAMEKNCEDEILSNLSERAQIKIASIKGNIDALKEKLNLLEKINYSNKDVSNIRRTIIAIMYIDNEFSWENMNMSNTDYVKNLMYSNMIAGNYTEMDVNTWFEAYRRIDTFDVHTAIEVIEEYMKDGYYKEYILWILYFLLYEKGLVTIDLLEKHLNACRREIEKVYTTLRTSRFIDAYTNSNLGCPIKQFKYIDKNKNDRLINLKEFKGIISKVDGTTKGTILLEDLNLKVFFTPSFTDEFGDKREFFSKHENEKVSFNLMFTYSGLRAWNVRLV